MEGFKLKDSRVSFPIIDENDNVISQHYIDAGNEAFLKSTNSTGRALLKKLEESRASGRLETEEGVDDCVSSMRDYIDMVFGEAGAFDKIYTHTNKNVISMIALCRAVTAKLKAAWKEQTSVYD